MHPIESLLNPHGWFLAFIPSILLVKSHTIPMNLLWLMVKSKKKLEIPQANVIQITPNSPKCFFSF